MSARPTFSLPNHRGGCGLLAIHKGFGITSEKILARVEQLNRKSSGPD
jgi:hypothetical protein